MGGTDLLPAALVAGFAVATKFAVDFASRIYQQRAGDELPGWVKQTLSFVIALVMTIQGRVDVFSGISGQSSYVGYILTALVLAGVASEVAHPAVEMVKSAGQALKPGDKS
jgi:hypothetical protein